MRKSDVIKKAEEFCKEHEITEYPVKIVDLCKKKGLRVFEQYLPEKVSGFIVYLPENDTSDDIGRNFKDTYGTTRFIVVNLTDGPGRRRFTVAHELAHFILHKDDSEEIYAHRDAGIYNAKESEANLFASNILMPEALVKKELKIFDDEYWGTALFSDKVDHISKKFAVTRSAAKVRLEQLGIS